MTPTTLHIGAAPARFEAFADFFDGAQANARRVGLMIDENDGAPELVLTPAEGVQRRWPLDKLRRVPDQAATTETILAVAGDPVARLVVEDDEARRILAARSPNLHKRPPVRGKGRLAAWAVAAVASVALIIFVLVPAIADQLAEFLPPEGEKALGDTTFDQIRSALDETGMAPLRICESPAGDAALARMADRLTMGVALPYPVQVNVLDHEMLNAFALPGGRVVFFRGLIEAAETPDEVAAVFAHELGHVAARDPARIALRSAGSVGVLGLLLGDFAGGAVVLFLTERLIQASYTQEAEAAADAFAHERLAAAGIPPSALADMFDRFRARHGEAEGVVRHFLSHPQLGDRIAAARAADALLTGPIRPALDAEAWRALRTICR